MSTYTHGGYDKAYFMYSYALAAVFKFLSQAFFLFLSNRSNLKAKLARNDVFAYTHLATLIMMLFYFLQINFRHEQAIHSGQF